MIVVRASAVSRSRRCGFPLPVRDTARPPQAFSVSMMRGALFDHLARQGFLQDVVTGCDHGRPYREASAPVREARIPLTPGIIGEAKVEIAKRAANGDMANRCGIT